MPWCRRSTWPAAVGSGGSTREEDDDDSTNVGGGLTVDQGTLYAVNGLAELVALDAAKGTMRWRSRFGAPTRSAPTVVEGRLFVTTIEDRLLALATDDGRQLWSHQAANRHHQHPGTAGAGLFRPGWWSAGFGSGELATLRAESGNGRVDRYPRRGYPQRQSGRFRRDPWPAGGGRWKGLRDRAWAGWPLRRSAHWPAACGSGRPPARTAPGPPGRGCSSSRSSRRWPRSTATMAAWPGSPSCRAGRTRRRRRTRSPGMARLLVGDRLVVAGTNRRGAGGQSVYRRDPRAAGAVRGGLAGAGRGRRHRLRGDRRRQAAGAALSHGDAALGGHRRPAECRQEHAVQPAGRAAAGAGCRHARRDARPQGGRGAAARPAGAAGGYRGAGGGGAGDARRADARGRRRGDRRRPTWCCSWSMRAPASRRPTGTLPTGCAGRGGRCCWWPTRRKGGRRGPRYWMRSNSASASRSRSRPSTARASRT